MEKKFYNDLSTYLIGRFGRKVWKVAVDAGFTCPNRDGTKSYNGCIYCNNDSFSHWTIGEITRQVQDRIEALKKKNIHAYIIYFQSYSNTYGTLEEIKNKIEASLIDDGIVAIHIGTRPDTIDREKLAYLAELNKRYEIVIEYGLQSSKPETLEFINRGHSVEDFVNAVKLTHEYGIKTCAHIILGLPNETKEEMMNSVRLVSSLSVHSVKFHNLHVVKDTELENMYKQGKIKLLNEREYAEILAEAVMMLPKDIVIARLVGDATESILVAPEWSRAKSGFLQMFTKLMNEGNMNQGDLHGR